MTSLRRSLPLTARRMICAGLGLHLCLAPAVLAQPTSLQKLPEVVLESAEPAVREQLEAQRARLNQLLEGNPKTADAQERAALARAYGELGQLYVLYDLALPAEAALGNAIELAPQEPRWPYLLASQHQLDNRVEAAIAGFRKVVELQPQNGAAFVRLGNLYLTAERSQAARSAFESALELEGTRAAALYGLGRVAKAQGDNEDAAKKFAEALQEQPEANLLHFHLGEAYRDLGEAERARFHFANRGDQKVFFYDPIALELQQLAGGVGALLSLGRISLSMGELDAAEERFRAALAIDERSAAALKALASALQLKGDLVSALETYERAVELEPDDAALRHFVATFIDSVVIVAEDTQTAREQRRHWDARAAEHLQAALEIAPDFVPSWVLLSDVRERQGDSAAADEALANAIAVAPDEFDLYYLRAKTLAQLGKKQEGLEALRVFDRESAKRETVLAPEARIERANLLIDLGDADAGSAALRQVAESDEPNVTASHKAAALFELGNRATERGELDLAVSYYQRSQELDSENALAAFNLGTVLGRLKRFDEAAAAHRRASELDPESQQARLAEGMALVLGGNHLEARQRLEEGLQVLPAAAPLAHLLTRLLIAAPEDEVRDPDVGLDLAVRLFDAIPSLQHGETVAMAFAATGRFEKAVEWQERVLEELEKQAPAEIVAQAKQRLETYRSEQTVIAPWAN